MLISGAVLFLSPPGRVANWTQWQILGLTKHGWTDLHVAFSALFLVVGVVHLVFNWRPLLQHLGARWTARSGFRWEWVVATLVAVGVFGATRAKLPPVSNLLAWSEQLKGGWESNRERAPIPHAELLSVAELAAQAGVGAEEALRRLQSAGVKDATLEARVQGVAETSGLTPARIYDLIRAETSRTGGAGGETSAHGPGAGGGPGRKTLAQFCQEEGLDLEAVRKRLSGRGIAFKPGETLREIAENNGFDRPFGLMEILREK